MSKAAKAPTRSQPADRFHLDPEFIRQPAIVGVEKGQQISLRSFCTLVSYPARVPAMRKGKKADPGIIEGSHCAEGIIRGAVIGDNDFQGRIVLRQHGTDGFAEQVSPVMSGNDDRDQRV